MSYLDRTVPNFMFPRALCFRPPSPDFEPTGPEEIRESPQKPLSKSPKYKSDLQIVPLGPSEQFGVYTTKREASSRSWRYCRIGRPGFLTELKDHADMLGSECPSFFNSVVGRFHLIRHVASEQGVSVLCHSGLF